MPPDRFQLLSELFEQALALAPADRPSFLDQRCNGDHALRAEIESLLSHAEKPDDPVVTAPGLDALFEEAGIKPRTDGQIPDVIGGNSNAHRTPSSISASLSPGGPGGLGAMPLLTGQYRILRVIGEGGMGIVYEAEQAFPKRRVALKSIRPGLFSRRMLRRFQNEAHILGRLQHPGIAHIYEAGASDPKSPDDAFFVMEFVDGPSLTVFAEQRNLRTRERVELMIKVCDAVHHAHQRGVIHRDLKPGNILVAEIQGSIQPKVLDFGVARVTDETHAHRPETMQTQAGQLIGTLAYMSPEQISAGPDDVDVRTDVYALGVIFYQLLTGKLPLELADKSIPDAAQMVRESQPSRLGTIDRAYRGDLETIVAKALEKDRERRYQSAVELGEDLRRYLSGEAIAAKRDSAAYVLRKFVKRHKSAVAAAMLMFAGLVAFGVVASMQASRNRALADELEMRLAIANADRGRLETLSGTPHLGERTLWTEHLQRPDLPETYWALWEHYSHQPILKSTGGAGIQAGHMLLTPDSSMIVRTARDGELQGWTADLDKCLWRVAPDGQSCTDVAMAPDGSVAAFVGTKGKLVLADPKTGAILRRINAGMEGGGADFYAVALSVDAKSVFTGDLTGELNEWDVATGRKLRRIEKTSGTIRALALSPDGSTLVFSRLGGITGVVDMTIPRQVGTLPIKTTSSCVLTFSADGGRFYAMTDAGVVHIFNTAGWAPIGTIETGDKRASSIAVLDDHSLITCGPQGIRIWNAETHALTASLRGDEGGSTEVVPGPRPGNFYTCGMGTCIRLWETSTLNCARRLPGGTTQMIASAEPDPEGKLIASVDSGGIVRLWDVQSAKLLGDYKVPDSRGRAVAWRPGAGGSEFVAGFNHGDIGLFRPTPEGPKLITSWKGHNSEICATAYSPDGALLATGAWSEGIKLWNAQTHELVRAMTTAQVAVNGLAFSPDGARLVSAGKLPGVAMFDVATGRQLAEIPDRYQHYRARFSPDGSVIAVAQVRPEIEILDGKSLKLLHTLRGHAKSNIDVHFSEDGKLLVSGCADGTIRLWDVASGRGLVSLNTGSEVSWAAFIPGTQGRRLVTSGQSGQARLFDLRYYDKHIAANTSYFLARLGPTLPKPAKTAELLAWARAALDNPNLTFDDPMEGVPMLPSGKPESPPADPGAD